MMVKTIRTMMQVQIPRGSCTDLQDSIECEPMEFTFSAQGPERAAQFVCPTGVWATPEQV